MNKSKWLNIIINLIVVNACLFSMPVNAKLVTISMDGHVNRIMIHGNPQLPTGVVAGDQVKVKVTYDTAQVSDIFSSDAGKSYHFYPATNNTFLAVYIKGYEWISGTNLIVNAFDNWCSSNGCTDTFSVRFNEGANSFPGSQPSDYGQGQIALYSHTSNPINLINSTALPSKRSDFDFSSCTFGEAAAPGITCYFDGILQSNWSYSAGGYLPDWYEIYFFLDPTTFSVSSKSSPPSTTYGNTSISGKYAEPVNTNTGNYFYQHTDLSLPGRGVPFTFTRTLNVQDANSGPFGSGWTHTYNETVTEQSDGSVVCRRGDGHEEFYDPIGDGIHYQSAYPGVFNTLVKNADSSFTLTEKNQTRFDFNTAGKLSSITDRNGNAITLTYNGAGDLSQITDTVGRAVNLSYNANHLLETLTDPAGRVVHYAYDADGRLISDTDANGGVMLYHYSPEGLMDVITDRRGNTLIANTYDSEKRVITQLNGKGAQTLFAYDTPNPGDTQLTDPLGRVTIHTHDDERRLISETDPLGHKIQYVYDADNNRIQTIDKNGQSTLFSYDTLGNVLTKTDALGNVTTLEYNSLNDPTRIIDALGHNTVFSYDATGNLTQVTNALGYQIHVAYDGKGQPVSVTDANGNVTLNTFDANGNLIQVKDALGHQTTFTYDAVGRGIAMTDANGSVSSFNYDNNDNLIAVTDPLGHTTHFSYDANNNRIAVTDPRGNATTFIYDANDLLNKAIDPLGGVVQFAHDAADNRIAVTDPRGNTTQYAYDSANRVVQVTNALGQPTALTYDANGNLLTQTNALGHTSSFTYDALNRLVAASDGLGNQGLRSYDALGRLIQSQDAKGRITGYHYDALGHLDQITDALSGAVLYDYDANGNRIGITNPNGHKTHYVYDALNRLVSKVDPLGQAYNYAYDPVGNRISLTDAKGQNLQYDYDANNRLVAITYSDNSQVTFSYDEAGNRIQMVDQLGTSTYTFDAMNRLLDYTNPFGKIVSNEFDMAGNRTALVYPNGKRVNYAYDALNRMASVTDWLGGLTDYSYDAANHLAEVLNPNNTKVVYGYDAAERLVNLANTKPDASILSSYALTMDAVGNRTGVNRNEPWAPLFSNSTQTLTFDEDNRTATINGLTVTHDANGNLIAEPGKSFQYDFEDRLIVANGSQMAEFKYDGTGNRLEAKRNGVTTRYTLDVSGAMSNVLVENDSIGNPIAYYVHGQGLISRITPTGSAHYYHYDTIGSTIALTNAAGDVTDGYSYDPFGQLLNAQTTVNNPFRYVGQFGVMQEGNGLQFMRARYYDAGVGRFINKDPISGNYHNSQSHNAYIYALNNPIKFLDANGLTAKEGGVNNYSLTDKLLDSRFAYDLTQEVLKELANAPNWRLVEVQGYFNSRGTWVQPYTRRVPNAVKSGATQIFLVLSPALQATVDSNREDLTGTQKIGRYSLTVLEVAVPVLGAADFGATLLFGGETVDQIKSDFFSSKNIVVDKLGDAILYVGGESFIQWSSQPNVLDYF